MMKNKIDVIESFWLMKLLVYNVILIDEMLVKLKKEKLLVKESEEENQPQENVPPVEL